ncbi:MAG TPA: hypothetical protein VH137_05565 [Gemmatimonadales bacterium]|nr:hypothetical protein [Gemmatimonadales bacterium]
MKEPGPASPGEQSGTPALQAVEQAPQCVGSLRSVSQPLFGSFVQMP